MRNALDKLDDTDLNGRRIRLVEDTRRKSRRSRSSSSRSRSRSRSRGRRSRSRSRYYSLLVDLLSSDTNGFHTISGAVLPVPNPGQSQSLSRGQSRSLVNATVTALAASPGPALAVLERSRQAGAAAPSLPATSPLLISKMLFYFFSLISFLLLFL